MATTTHQRPHSEATPPAAKVEDSDRTTDEQHAGISDRERCISVAAYLRAELGDGLESEKEEDSGQFDLN